MHYLIFLALFIAAYLLFQITYLIGYITGRHEKPEEKVKDAVKQTINKTIMLANTLTKDQIPTGRIKPKTAQEIWLKSRPKKEQEGLQAMKETFDTMPELKHE